MTFGRKVLISTIVWVIVLQIGLTIIIPAQSWSMPVGLAAIISICSISTIIYMPRNHLNKWRWHMTSVALSMWAFMFVAIAYQANFSEHKELYSIPFAIIHQALLIAVLLPTTSNEEGNEFKLIDLAQGLLFSVSLASLTWTNRLWGLPTYSNALFVKVGYLVLSTLAILAFMSNQCLRHKQLTTDLLLLIVGYAIVSATSHYISIKYNIMGNSPLWVIGDVTFLLYLFRVSVDQNIPQISFIETQNKRQFVQHLSSAFLTLAIVMITFCMLGELPNFARVTIVFAVLLYIIRAMLLLDKYLKFRDKLILRANNHSQLLIDLMHDVRAPLGSIVLHAAMLTRRQDPDQEANWLNQIGSGAERVTVILDDVLELEKIDAGYAQLNFERFDLSNIVDTCVGSIILQADINKISIDQKYAREIFVYNDKSIISRVLTNVLSNALKYTKTRGRVIIHAECNLDGSVILKIQDDGIGISDKMQGSLFKRFDQVGKPINGSGGHGLGLSIAHGLMQAVGGNLGIQSQANDGTTVSIYVPNANRSTA